VASSPAFIGERGALTDRGVRAVCDKYAALIAVKLYPHLLRHNNGNDLVGLGQMDRKAGMVAQ
jgi:integrase/recombinase XerC